MSRSTSPTRHGRAIASRTTPVERAGHPMADLHTRRRHASCSRRSERYGPQTGAAAARRLTTATHREYAPAVSPDGKWVAYVSWDDRERGQLWKSCRDQRRQAAAAHHRRAPVCEPGVVAGRFEDRAVVAGAELRQHRQRRPKTTRPTKSSGSAPPAGRRTSVVSVRPRNAGRWFPAPRFGADNDRVFYVAASSDTRNDLVLDRARRRPAAGRISRFKYIEDAAPSPDGKRVAFVSMDDLYVTDMPTAPASEPHRGRSRTSGGATADGHARRRQLPVVDGRRRDTDLVATPTSPIAWRSRRPDAGARRPSSLQGAAGRFRAGQLVLRGAGIADDEGRRGHRDAVTSSSRRIASRPSGRPVR